MKRILIIEDDLALTKGLESAITAEHYEVLTAADGEKGYALATKEKIDLIILDLNLPMKSGLDILKELRSSGMQIPILVLTSKTDETDVVVGLELGADDYVKKPFGVKELQARIHALLRRQAGIESKITEYTFGDVYLDFKKQEALRDKKPLELTVREFEILKFLIEHEGEVVTRDMLLDHVWGYDQMPTTRTVDNYVLSIRKKIEKDSANPVHILTVHTAGYKFVR